MEKLIDNQMPGKDNRTFDNSEANDLQTFMTDMQRCMNKLEADGYTDQYKIEKGKLHDLTNKKNYKAKEVKAVNFYRFEGQTDPDDMSILYAIETTDGCKGTLSDAYGHYADPEIGKFMKEVEVNKKPKS